MRLLLITDRKELEELLAKYKNIKKVEENLYIYETELDTVKIHFKDQGIKTLFLLGNGKPYFFGSFESFKKFVSGVYMPPEKRELLLQAENLEELIDNKLITDGMKLVEVEQVDLVQFVARYE